MEFCATKQRVYFSDKNKKASYKIINYGDYYDVDYYDNNLKNEVFDWIVNGHNEQHQKEKNIKYIQKDMRARTGQGKIMKIVM